MGGLNAYTNYIISARPCCDWTVGSMIAIWANSEVFISNNILIDTGGYKPKAIYCQYPANVIVCNNVMKTNHEGIIFEMSGGNYITHSVYNNILLNGGNSGIANMNNTNNIGNTTQFSVGNDNQQNVVMNTVFVDPDNYNFHLLEGSPAIAAGLDGTDCGIYGGTFPFVDNGRTWLPIITEVSVPTVVNINNGLNVTVKAKSGK